ncbi:MAG: phosphatidylglycerophosphatase A, partial [Arenicellales bacterium]|nr:phosphatidylglycerophosphatase A [Arenicellales bacterium]
IDEIAGILVTLALVPPSVPALLTGFVLFRLLDISKPPPISAIDQRLRGGFGIVADDVVAGLGANLCLQLLFRWGGAFG